MTKQQTRRVTWEVRCPDEDDAPLGTVYDNSREAERDAEAHNAQFTPRHNAQVRRYFPDPWDPDPPDFDTWLATLSGEQSKTATNAALLVIGARRDAAALLTRNGLAEFSDDFFGSRCRARTCGCGKYVGEADYCERSSCRHSAGQHAT
ncbi:DUF6422 family protein [Streptomyces sp. NPDC059352]|uniref:DUF6422 family protein n=1 Tax=Streptomyces sp. NPDC059352 TaxID=3346810 RepID=UPI003682F163